MEEENKISKNIVEAVNIPVLVSLIVSYVIGAAFVSYLGRYLNGLIFWLGLAVVILFYLSSEFLARIYYYSIPRETIERSFQLRLKNFFLQTSLAFLATGAGITVLIFFLGKRDLEIWLFLAMFFVLDVIFVMRPFDWRNKGYRDLLDAFNLAVLTPAFAVVLQLGEIHSSLLLITFPIFFLIIAIILALSLEHYYADLKSGHRTLMTMVGWKTGMNLHNIFLLLFYLTYGIGAVLGLPSRLLLPALVAFPFSLLEFWELSRIGSGEKPRWVFLKFVAWASVGVMTYFLIFNLWIG
ncbi:MAG: hypothetical protein BGO78_15650 [Chloroflexi bacterium 44-23]|nr:MAG: hypothetical protein BGO78_15650 [Chloroflexi bacterium 44-23]